jgi:DNA-binding beta-propeller fold protein YncE
MWRGLVAMGLAVVVTGPTHRDTAAMNGAHSPGGVLAVVNQKEHSVEFVDPATRTIVGTVSVGVNGHEIAASPDGKTLYVPIYGNAGVGRPGTDGSTIDVIDVAGRRVVRTINLGRPLRPHKPAFGPDGMLYVSGELAQAIEVIDPATGKVVGQVPTGAEQSHMFVLTRDGKRAYSANVGPGTVSVMDVPGRRTVAVIAVAKTVQRMAISNDQRWVFTSDEDQPRVAVIDTRTNTLSRWIATGGIPYVTQPTPDGKYLLVAETKGAGGLLEVVHLADWKVTKSFPLAAQQNGGFLLHDGVAYLSEPKAGTIEVLDLKSWKLEEPIRMTLGVDGLAWAR